MSIVTLCLFDIIIFLFETSFACARARSAAIKQRCNNILQGANESECERKWQGLDHSSGVIIFHFVSAPVKTFSF